MSSTRDISFAAMSIFLAGFSVSAQAEWNFQITPYLWASNLDGTTTVAGRDIDFDASFSDLVSSLDAGGAIRFDAQADTWGLFLDGMVVKLKDDEQTAVGTLGFTVKQEIIEGGISYRLTEQLNAYAGARYQKIDQDVTLPVIGDRNISDSWADGIIGLHWLPVNTDKWTLWLRGDIGAGDSDSIWLAGVGGGYKFNKTWSLLAAYRYLSTDFESDDLKWDVDQYGLGIGLGISW